MGHDGEAVGHGDLRARFEPTEDLEDGETLTPTWESGRSATSRRPPGRALAGRAGPQPPDSAQPNRHWTMAPSIPEGRMFTSP